MHPITESALLLTSASILAGTFKKPEASPAQNDKDAPPVRKRLVGFLFWLDVRFRFVVLTAAYMRVVYLLTRLVVYAVLWLLNPEVAGEFMRPS